MKRNKRTNLKDWIKELDWTRYLKIAGGLLLFFGGVALMVISMPFVLVIVGIPFFIGGAFMCASGYKIVKKYNDQ